MSVTVDMTAFSQKLNELQGFGLSGGRILRVESRKMLQSVMRQSHPQNKAQGDGAVRRDLLKVFFPIEDATMDGATPMTGQHSGFIKLWVTDAGKKVISVKRENFKPSATMEQMEQWHRATRGDNGRVRGTGFGIRTEVRGKLNFINRIVVRESIFEAYQSKELSHVGKLRSGFGHGLAAMGGSVPGWVKKHLKMGEVTGFVRQALQPGPKPSVTFGNTAAGAAPRLGDIVKRALASRVKAMTTNIRRMIKYGPGKAGDYGYALK